LKSGECRFLDGERVGWGDWVGGWGGMGGWGWTRRQGDKARGDKEKVIDEIDGIDGIDGID